MKVIAILAAGIFVGVVGTFGTCYAIAKKLEHDANKAADAEKNAEADKPAEATA